jgi:Rieske Fe-S protein
MATCDVCGNDYDKSFEVTMGGTTRTFDSFECAIQALAPTCAHCGCRVIGHGVESDGRIFCCAHCAGQEGVAGVADRA